jgi:hypothetical protein
MLVFAMALYSLALFCQVEESIPLQGQEKEKLSFSQRLVFGGDIGLSFGSITYIKLAPIVGYRITDRFTAGLGPIYIYEKYRDYHLETSTYGGKVAASFTIIKATNLPKAINLGDIALHAENEVVNVEKYDPYLGQFSNRVWIDNLLLGAGITQSLGGKFAVSIFILWDVTQNPYSPYSNPIFKFGFSF